MDPVLSMCMVTQDDACWLSTLLAGAAEQVDEIVVVDLGSTDDTVAVARRAGARVIDMPRRVAPARARGIALSAARGRWCLLLEPGEQVLASTWRSLCRFVAEAHHPLGTVWLVPAAGGGRRWRALRLCREDLRFTLVLQAARGHGAAALADTGLVCSVAGTLPCRHAA